MKIKQIYLSILFVAAVFAGGCEQDASQKEWTDLLNEIKRKYPDVSYITTEELSLWIGDEKRVPPVIIDVREKEEHQVSHIPKAILIPPRSNLKEKMEGVGFSRPIVTYCSVGYRSAELATRLGAMGYRNIKNLEGSIFKWANERRILLREGKRVSEVHPYNDYWGRYLNSSE